MNQNCSTYSNKSNTPANLKRLSNFNLCAFSVCSMCQRTGVNRSFSPVCTQFYGISYIKAESLQTRNEYAGHERGCVERSPLTVCFGLSWMQIKKDGGGETDPTCGYGVCHEITKIYRKSWEESHFCFFCFSLAPLRSGTKSVTLDAPWMAG